MVEAEDINVGDTNIQKVVKTLKLAENTQGEYGDGEEQKPQDCDLKPVGRWRRKNEQKKPKMNLGGGGAGKPCYLLLEILQPPRSKEPPPRSVFLHHTPLPTLQG